MADIPANTSTTSVITVNGGAFTNQLEVVGDRDWVRVSLSAGQAYQFALDGSGGTPLGDPILRLYDAYGNLVALDDDSGPDANSLLNFVATQSGTYYLAAGGFNDAYTGTYSLTATTPATLPVITNQEIASYLTDGFWADSGRARHAFATSTITYNIQNLTAEGQALAVAAFNTWSAVSGLTFVATAGAAQISFDDNQSGAFASYSASGGTTTSAFVNVSTQWLANYGTTINSYSFQTYIHEIGHALGLGHAGNYNGSAGYSPTGTGDNDYLNDSWQPTVMSYFSQDENTYVNASYAFVVGPMMADVIAIQDLYGVPTTANAGATTYGFNSTATGYFNFANFSQGNMVAFTIYDSGGVDTLDASGFTADQRIDLRAGNYSNIGGETGNIGIAVNALIENAVGGSGGDALYGNSAANQLDGRAGTDSLIGFTGNDTYYVDVAGDRVFEAAGGGTADRVIASVSYVLAAGQQVEILATSAAGTAAIHLTGNEIAQSIYGNAGRNIINGQGGADVLTGYGGIDTFRFSIGPSSGVDRIADFSSADDTIQMYKSVFVALTAGTLDASAYKDIGDPGATVDVNDRILYNDDTGALFYDSNGSEAGGRVQFATLLNAPATLTAADFVVV